MSKQPSIIQGKQHKDARGSIHFVNAFSMDAVKRFYIISPENTQIIRAWQGHKKEEKWFYALKGRFLVVLIKIDNWETPAENLNHQAFILEADKNQVLHIPEGYVNGFKALEKTAQLLVYSNATLAESTDDNYRFEANKWFDWSKNEI